MHFSTFIKPWSKQLTPLKQSQNLEWHTVSTSTAYTCVYCTVCTLSPNINKIIIKYYISEAVIYLHFNIKKRNSKNYELENNSVVIGVYYCGPWVPQYTA